MDEAVKWLGGIVVGFLGAFAIFSSRVTTVERDLAAHIREAAENRKHDKEMLELSLEAIHDELTAQNERAEVRHKSIERRQSVALEIIAAVARKLNVSHRALGTDALVNADSENND